MAIIEVNTQNQMQMLAEAEEGTMPDAEVKPEVKTEPKAAEAKPAIADAGIDTDDEEGEDGLTPRQKREFTESMLKTLAKKHSKQKSAEEFAVVQYNERQLERERAEKLARENEELKARLVPKIEPKAEPKRENFQTDGKFQDALIDWKVDQRLQKERLDAMHEREQSIMQAANQRIARALELVPDFKEKTEAVDYIIPSQVAALMQESELFAELGYHFADHPEDLGRLAVLPAERLKVEFRKIESKLSPFGSSTGGPKVENGNGSDNPSPNGAKPNGQEPSQTGTTPSKSRAPVIRPLSTSSGAQVEKDEDDMSPREALAAWQRKNDRNLNRRKRH